MSTESDTAAPAFPTLEDWQHWTQVMGRAQQMMLETWADSWKSGDPAPGLKPPNTPDPMALLTAGAEAWGKGLEAWGQMLGGMAAAADRKDKRFAAPEWRDNPLFDTIRQSYLAISDQLTKTADEAEGLDAEAHARLKFLTASFVDAMSPSNFALTNPQVLKATMDSRGENLLTGLRHMLDDMKAGQMTHVAKGHFEVGRNLATTPGKVIHETPLYQLIQYTPTTDKVLETPLIVFPPWINRFYILDLTPEKSFVRWCVEQGITLFMVSWKSADESIKDVTLDDYVLRGQVDAIDTVRDLLGVKSVHTIGYCVAGTTLAATLALLAARGEAAKVASATFFTAQVDFEQAGDLRLFLGDETMGLLGQLSADTGIVDGRVMASTFNLLRGRDLIWNYVTNNYLLGKEPPPFDLLHWNGDVTNLPAGWHRDYLETLYKGNKLVEEGGITVDGTPIDLGKIATPLYIQAGREDHIAPPQSVWKIMDHVPGPKRFVLAGSGHIAGVVNPPSAGKYQYWLNEGEPRDLDAFIEGATEHKGSWWPDWLAWLTERAAKKVAATGARVPGKGKLKAIEDAPGRYVRTR
ncbi:PHA/PHB synthase family protein [Sphingomonas glaciei]|uniref:Class I poly(R)-hydroxyalkanoic acid synthase n=1 Tax=Sphingomonas glaciei TaxID=2938948 RepID=A0ABY5MS09_9SPHN|nr:class I poly(R)-hydroxyalkanoic acid synthase [Sphingomonas glaciei]UUR06923.1 class I poly(R)-hydroxyalkanoic acid synthase [Sphingomonas glaciei]